MYQRTIAIKSLKWISFLSFLFCFLFDVTKANAQSSSGQIVVVLSLDGFRWDYPVRTYTPSLNEIASAGVKAVSLIPSFPSKTFPNHYTIATGLVPDHHGLVNNSFYDTDLNLEYSIGNKKERFNPVFYGGEPIWITASNQGVRTASFFWVGSDVAIQGKHPDFWKPYEEQVQFSKRIDTLIKWVSLPANKRPRLIMSYYHEPDGVGHKYGPDDLRTLSKVHELDSLVGILYHRLKQLPNADSINLIVLSDHGMGSISSDRNVSLRDYIPENWPVRIEGGNPNFNLYAKSIWSDSVYNKLSEVKGIKIWKPAEVPEYLCYGKNQRVGNLIVVADSSWSVTINKPKNEFQGGTHGYEIRNSDIHAIFYAVGPAFKKNFTHPTFQNTNIYPLLAHLLGINPVITDGDLMNVITMLKP